MQTADADSTPTDASAFSTTSWTVVLQSCQDGDDGHRAMEALCRAYWVPLYAYLRRRGHSPHDAEDNLQAFLADMISRRALNRADRSRGRFRTFILSALNNALHNAHDRDTAIRRGGGVQRIPIDSVAAAEAVASLSCTAATPDEAFDRDWALAILDRALRQLRAEQARSGKERLFDRLKFTLQQRAQSGEYEAIAAEFGMSRNAVAITAHRLSTRLRGLVQAEVYSTVDGKADAADELRMIVGLLSK